MSIERIQIRYNFGYAYYNHHMQQSHEDYLYRTLPDYTIIDKDYAYEFNSKVTPDMALLLQVASTINKSLNMHDGLQSQFLYYYNS